MCVDREAQARKAQKKSEDELQDVRYELAELTRCSAAEIQNLQERVRIEELQKDQRAKKHLQDRKEITALQHQIDELVNLSDDARGELNALNRRVIELESELSKAREGLEAASSDALAFFDEAQKLQTTVDRYKADLEASLSDFAAGQARIRVLEDEVGRCRWSRNRRQPSRV